MQSTFSFLQRAARPGPAETDVERRLRELPPVYARPVPADVDVADVVGTARAVVRSLEDHPHVAGLVTELDACADALERADARVHGAIAALGKATLALDPPERERAARHAPVLAAAMRPAAPLDERAVWDAHAWVEALAPSVAARAVAVVRREHDLVDAEELRGRAYHALRVALRRAVATCGS
jgi:hypothetical protein